MHERHVCRVGWKSMQEGPPPVMRQHAVGPNAQPAPQYDCPSHCSPGSTMPLPHRPGTVVEVVLVVEGGGPAIGVPTELANASARDSIVPASPPHGPFASARAKPSMNRASLLA